MPAGQKNESRADAAGGKDKKPRGPVSYIAFAEIRPGWWALVAAGRESSSVYALRRELREELSAAQAEAGEQVTDAHTLVILPLDQAHVVEAAQTITVKETFTKTSLKPAPPLSSLITGPKQLGPEAAIAERMGAGAPAPEGAGPGDLSPEDAERADAAAQAALAAAADARAAQVPPVDPEDDEEASNPDIDPATGLSRRPASEARPEDEGRTVFPVDNDL